MVSTIDPGLEKEAKEFQKTTADLVVKELAPRAAALRQRIETRIAMAIKAGDNFEQQIKDESNEIDRIGVLTDDLRSQFQKQRENLAALYQRTATAPPAAGEGATLEAEIRELHEQISSLTNLMGRLTLERSRLIRELTDTQRLREAQDATIANAQFEKNGLVETYISLPAMLMPAMEPTKRRLVLLLVALAVSLLVGFGTIVMSHNMSARKT
jgi:chromosome segregation ATPase